MRYDGADVKFRTVGRECVLMISICGVAELSCMNDDDVATRISRVSAVYPEATTAEFEATPHSLNDPIEDPAQSTFDPQGTTSKHTSKHPPLHLDLIKVAITQPFQSRFNHANSLSPTTAPASSPKHLHRQHLPSSHHSVHIFTMPQVLPSKEASLFRQVVKCYESKQYKKGLKT